LFPIAFCNRGTRITIKDKKNEPPAKKSRTTKTNQRAAEEAFIVKNIGKELRLNLSGGAPEIKEGTVWANLKIQTKPYMGKKHGKTVVPETVSGKRPSATHTPPQKHPSNAFRGDGKTGGVRTRGGS